MTRHVHHVFYVISLESRSLFFVYLHTRTHKSSNTILKVNILNNTRPSIKEGVKIFQRGNPVSCRVNRPLISYLISKQSRLSLKERSCLVFCFGKAVFQRTQESIILETSESKMKTDQVIACGIIHSFRQNKPNNTITFNRPFLRFLPKYILIKQERSTIKY